MYNGKDIFIFVRILSQIQLVDYIYEKENAGAGGPFFVSYPKSFTLTSPVANGVDVECIFGIGITITGGFTVGILSGPRIFALLSELKSRKRLILKCLKQINEIYLISYYSMFRSFIQRTNVS